MELVYLWVKKYKNIENEGFDFSSRFHCKYENGVLKIENNPEYIPNLFNEKMNVTAIVGSNGSGKSSLLEIIFNKYDTFTLNEGLFFVYFNDIDENFIFLGANAEEIDHKKYKVNLLSEMKVLPDTKTIYFSNILNENDLLLPSFFVDVDHTHSVNISTTHLLNQMKLIETSSNAIVDSSNTKFDKIYRSYRIQQILGALILIKDQVIKIPFTLPQEITIRNIDFHEYIKSIKNKFENDAVYHKILDILESNNDDPTIFKNYLSTNLIISLLLENIEGHNPIKDELFQIVLDTKLGSALEDFYNNVKRRLEEQSFSLSSGENISASYINNFFELSDKLIEQTSSFNIEYSQFSGYEMVLNIEETDFTFLETYERIIQQSEYFWDINWRGLSSGEESYLYQFSRFYQLSKGFKTNPYLNLTIDGKEAKNLIFLIDEGEDTMHPRWQKSYIHYLSKFFIDNFKQNIHLIITSHSPFIVSDLPRGNIVFLENGKQVEGTIKQQTFGANIHTLLSDGFFMEHGLVGEFAKETIQDVIDFLKGKESKINDPVDARKIIDIVGEPFLKMQLEKMHNKKFPEMFNREQKIRELKNELERLENVENRKK